MYNYDFSSYFCEQGEFMIEILIEKKVRTDKEGYEFLIGLYQRVKSQRDKDVRLDFSLCQSFDANLSSVLGAILDELMLSEYTFWFARLNTGVLKTLTKNGFLKTAKGDFQTIAKEQETFIRYQKFSIIEGNTFKSYIDSELINKQKFPKHTENVGKNINANIYEIFVNATIHGNCKSVYCCGEYHPDKSPPKLDMTIVDCGTTIHENVNTFFKSIKKDHIEPDYAIEWAIREGNTTKDTTGGLGLSLLMEFLSLNKGSLHIISSSGELIYEDGQISTARLNDAFPGTIVNMQFNFDDDKIYYMSNEKTDLNNLL